MFLVCPDLHREAVSRVEAWLLEGQMAEPGNKALVRGRRQIYDVLKNPGRRGIGPDPGLCWAQCGSPSYGTGPPRGASRLPA